MEHHGFPKREGTHTGRVVNWAQVCRKFLWRKLGENADPNLQSKVWCSYASKNNYSILIVFDHVLNSRHQCVRHWYEEKFVAYHSQGLIG